MLKRFKNVTFDVVVFSSFDRGYLQIELPLIQHLLKQVKHKKYYFDINNHHIYHAVCGHHFSKFDEAVALVSDGGGEIIFHPFFRAIQSIFLINKKEIIPKYKYFSNKKMDYFDNFVPIEKKCRKKWRYKNRLRVK